MRVPLTRLGKVNEFQGDKLDPLVPSAESKLGTYSFECGEHGLHVLGIESEVA
jgi:hypothetical protein